MADWLSDPEEDLTVVELLSRCVQEVGDEVFLDFAGSEYTYRQVFDRAAMYAAGLRQAGATLDDAVVTMLDNNVDAVSLWFGINLIGAVWVPINTALKGTFLSHIVTDSGCKTVVCEADFIDRFSSGLAEMPSVERILVRGLDSPTQIGTVRIEPLDQYLVDCEGQSWVERTSRVRHVVEHAVCFPWEAAPWRRPS